MTITSKAFALAAASTVALGAMAVTSVPAEAGWRTGYRHAPVYRGYGGYHPGYYGRHRGWRAGPAVGLGIAAGILGAGALAATAAPAYGYPAYGYQPVCRWRVQPVWDEYYGGYVNQRVQVCN